MFECSPLLDAGSLSIAWCKYEANEDVGQFLSDLLIGGSRSEPPLFPACMWGTETVSQTRR